MRSEVRFRCTLQMIVRYNSIDALPRRSQEFFIFVSSVTEQDTDSEGSSEHDAASDSGGATYWLNEVCGSRRPFPKPYLTSAWVDPVPVRKSRLIQEKEPGWRGASPHRQGRDFTQELDLRHHFTWSRSGHASRFQTSFSHGKSPQATTRSCHYLLLLEGETSGPRGTASKSLQRASSSLEIPCGVTLLCRIGGGGTA